MPGLKGLYMTDQFYHQSTPVVTQKTSEGAKPRRTEAPYAYGGMSKRITTPGAAMSAHLEYANPSESLLSRLEGVKQRGPGSWVARCPAHDDKSPSLSVRETGDGVLLLHCFGGCAPADIVAAVGMELADLFPPRPTAASARATPEHHHKPRRKPPIPWADVIKSLSYALTAIRIAAGDMAKGKTLSGDDLDTLQRADDIIKEALRLACHG